MAEVTQVFSSSTVVLSGTSVDSGTTIYSDTVNVGENGNLGVQFEVDFKTDSGSTLGLSINAYASLSGTTSGVTDASEIPVHSITVQSGVSGVTKVYSLSLPCRPYYFLGFIGVGGVSHQVTASCRTWRGAVG